MKGRARRVKNLIGRDALGSAAGEHPAALSGFDAVVVGELDQIVLVGLLARRRDEFEPVGEAAEHDRGGSEHARRRGAPDLDDAGNPVRTGVVVRGRRGLSEDAKLEIDSPARASGDRERVRAPILDGEVRAKEDLAFVDDGAIASRKAARHGQIIVEAVFLHQIERASHAEPPGVQRPRSEAELHGRADAD